MRQVLYRPRLRRLLDEIMDENPARRVADINISKIADDIGISRQVVWSWYNADTDNPADWLTRYDLEFARKLSEFFSDVLGREVQVMERVEARDFRKGQALQSAFAA